MTDWAEEDPTPELVKATVTLWDVADMLGLEVNKQGKVKSPYNPEERTPSCQLHDDFFYYFSTGRHGDVITFTQALSPGMSFGKALRLLWFRALKAGKEPGDVEKSPARGIPDFTEELENYTHIDYNDTRFDNLSPPHNVRLVQPPGSLLIPHADQDGVYGVKVRHINGKKDAWPGSQFSKRLYNPHGWQQEIGGTVFLTEGETDAWAMEARLNGWYDVLALPSGAGTFRDHWLKDLKPADLVVLCFDNDRAGRDAQAKWLAKLGRKALTLPIPGLAKDVREAVALFPNWNPLELL